MEAAVWPLIVVVLLAIPVVVMMVLVLVWRLMKLGVQIGRVFTHPVFLAQIWFQARYEYFMEREAGGAR